MVGMVGLGWGWVWCRFMVYLALSFRVMMEITPDFPCHVGTKQLFPGSLMRRLYRKKIPENRGNVPIVP